jgi:hypothetical protein
LKDKTGSGKPLVYVRYLDHALYRDMAPSSPKPMVRETVGWLVHEDDESLWIVWDRNVAPSRYERNEPYSSLVIVKKCILEVRRIC